MTKVTCTRCEHEWTLRGKRIGVHRKPPRECPKCHSPNWQRPQKTKLTGGSKLLWVKQHEGIICQYYELHGAEATCSFFDISADNLNLCLKGADKMRPQRDTGAALIIAQIAQATAIEAKTKVRELEAKYEQFTEAVANELLTKFFLPMLRTVIKLPDGFEKQIEANPLSLTGVDFRQLTESCRASGMRRETSLREAAE